MMKTRRASALLTIATHPRMIAAVAATVAGCLALLMAFAVGLVGASSASAAGTTYTIKNLGTLPGTISSYAYDVNDSGQVVGQGGGDDEEGPTHAFLYSESTGMQDLGTLPGGTYSLALGINDLGEVVGDAHNGAEYRAFLYSGGQMQALGTMPSASAINDSGQVVGNGGTGEGYSHALLYSDGQVKDLGTLGGSESGAYDINDSGHVVGWASTSSEEGRAFLYSDGQMKDLGTLGGTQSGANAINNSGQIVGYASTSTGQQHAFLYSGGRMDDLGMLPGSVFSSAYDVNASGQVVGESGEWAGLRSRHAFVYSDGQMHNLNDLIPADSGWHLIGARAINASGQIVGQGILDGHGVRAFLATPDNTTPQPVDSASSEVAAGGTLSTATGDGTATSSDPVNTTITSPVGGKVSITETSTTQQAPSGFTFFGKQVNIEAPEATVESPLTLKFVLDASLLPEGQDPNTIELFRDGTLASECADASGTASPDPCVSKRETLAGGDVAITVLTSHASAWNFAAPSYEFGGLYSPVDNLPTLNKAKAGSAIPVKFSLGGDMGLNVFAKDQSGSYPKSGSIACDQSANADTIEQTLNAGSSSLSYDASSDRYTYVWKTDKSWQNSCRQLVLKFKDGTEHRADFQLTK